MKTLNANYNRNIEILKENLKRGMTAEMANNAINGMENQFKRSNLYGENEQDYINAMRATVIEHFTHISVTV